MLPLMVLTAHTLNSKVNSWGTRIASIGYVTFEHIKGTEHILVECILRL